MLKPSRDTFHEPTALRLLGQVQRLSGDEERARATLQRAAASAARRGGPLERSAVAALLGESPPPEELRAALRWLTAGAVSR